MIGTFRKLKSTLASPIQYQLPIGNELIDLNACLNKTLIFEFTGRIVCVNCERQIKNSFNQGYCYPCFTKLAECDLCIMKPELCHYDKGTCRDPVWGQTHCMQPHIVYLSHTSGLKVGITRFSQIPTRWIDQGAVQAIPIFQVKTRYQSGLIEVALKSYVNDKTNWRQMLKETAPIIDMQRAKEEICQQADPQLVAIREQFPNGDITQLSENATIIDYPVQAYPCKVVSHNFEKTPKVSGKLLGIKGQYLILDTGVLNIRKFTGYEVNLEKV